MDFTKITPIELNGQRVATTGYLYSYLAEVYKLNYRTAERRITKARHSITLDKDADYFVDINVGSPIYYTKSGVIKLSDYRNVEVLKDFAAVYFDTDALPATEPAEVETPDVTDLIPVDYTFETFTNSKFGSIRTIIIDGITFFVGKDVALALGYKDTDKAIRDHVDDEDKMTYPAKIAGQVRHVTVINESGLYSLILSSKLPAAKEFKHWGISLIKKVVKNNEKRLCAGRSFQEKRRNGLHYSRRT